MTEQDKFRDSINDSLTNKIYNVTTEMQNMLRIDDDVIISSLDKSINAQTGNGGNITDAKIRKGNKLDGIYDNFKSFMDEMGKRYVHDMPWNDRIRLNRELNYFLTQIPALHATMQSLTSFIMSPDNYGDDEINMKIFSGSAETTETDIKAYLEDKSLYKLIKDGILGSLELGYVHYSVIPLNDIAQRLLDRVNTMSNKSRNNIASGSGSRVARSSTLFASAESHSDKYTDVEDIIFFGESQSSSSLDKKVVIPRDKVILYREAYNNMDTRQETANMILDAVDEALGINEYDKTYKMYAESMKGKAVLTEQERKEAIGSLFFSETPYSIADRDLYASKIHHMLMGEPYHKNSGITKSFVKSVYGETDRGALAEKLIASSEFRTYAEAEGVNIESPEFKEALKNLKKKKNTNSRTKVRDLDGCHVTLLDNEKIHIQVLNKEITGDLVVDLYKDYNITKTVVTNMNNVLGSSQFQDQADYRDNPIVRRDIIDGLAGIIKKHLDTNFITDNKRLLGTIEALLDEADMYGLQFRVRFIPRKYLVPFNAEDDYNGIGKSKLTYARVPIIFSIYLRMAKMMDKLYYEKDKIWIKYDTTFSRNIWNDRQDAMDYFTNLFPLPSELLDFSKVFGTMATVGRFMTPVGKNGRDLFTIDRIEGQKQSTDGDEFMGSLQNEIEQILGFPMSGTLNTEGKGYDFATSLIIQDGRLAIRIRDLQRHYAPMASELATKIARFESGAGDDVDVVVTFNEPRVLNKQISNDNFTKFSEHIENILKVHFGENRTDIMTQEKEIFIRKELVKKYYPEYDYSEDLKLIEEAWKVFKNLIEEVKAE